MSNIVGSLLGDSNAPSVDINRKFSTGSSTLAGGNIDIDPSIRGLYDESLGTTRGLLSSTLASRDDLIGNRGDFIQSRTNPLRERIAQRRGTLNKELGRRGVFGTFANKERTNLDIEGERALADAETQALSEALQTEAGFTQLAQGLNMSIAEIAAGKYNNELQALGLSVNSILGMTQAAQTSAGMEDAAGQFGMNTWMKIAGGIASAFSDERLKTNIEQIGVLPNGLKWYKFTLFGRLSEGVMAQEVEKLIPEAVGERDGYKTVNYSMIWRVPCH